MARAGNGTGQGRTGETPAETRDRLVGIARGILARTDPVALPMRQLVSESGMSGATIYSIFGSKNLILHAILREEIAEMHARVMAFDCPNGVERFLGAIQMSVDAFYDEPGFMRAVTSCLFGQTADFKIMVTEPETDLWRDLLREMADEGCIEPHWDIDLLGHVLLSAYIGMIRHQIVEDMPPVQFGAHVHLCLAMPTLGAATAKGRAMLIETILAKHAMLACAKHGISGDAG